MATKPKPPPPPANAVPQAQNIAPLSGIKIGKIEPKKRPPRMVLMAPPGWGKTTVAAYAGGLIIQAIGETGYETLLGEGMVPSIDAGVVSEWQDLLNTLDVMLMGEIKYPYLSMDALAGFEALCNNYICDQRYGGNFDAFLDWGKGPWIASREFEQLTKRLDLIHRRGVGIIILSHSVIKKIKNPLGEDYDKYVPNVHEKTWKIVEPWADTVLFGKRLTVTDTDVNTKRVRGIGGTQRVIYCNEFDAWSAKNRYGMPDRIDIPNDPALVWATIDAAINANATARAKGE